MDKWLSRLANLAILLVAVAVLYNWWAVRSQPSATAAEFKAGDRLDAAALGLTDASLLVITRSTCRYCTASMPFYASLSNERMIAIASGEDVATNAKYLESHGVKPRRVISSQDAEVHVGATPTLILVDAEGVVLGAWRGKLTEEGEQEVRDKIASLD